MAVTIQRAKGAIQVSTTGAVAGRGKGAVQVKGDAGATCALTGTLTENTYESSIVTGGKTIILTLTGDTWAAAGTGAIGSTADTQAIIDGITSAQSETFGWNNEVRDKEVVGAVVRTSSTIATITLTAAAAYNITADETITATVPAAALVTSTSSIVASPTVSITAGLAGTITLTEPTDDKVYPRVVSTDNRVHTVSGTFTGTVVDVEARIVLDGTDTETVTWSTIESSPTGGTFTGTITIPSGGPYNIDVRFSNDIDTIDNGANGFLVGAVVLFVGQSNAERMFSDGSGQTPNAKARFYNNANPWAVPTAVMNGAIGFANKYITDTGTPVGMLSYGAGGTALTAATGTSLGVAYWDDYASAPYLTAKNAVTNAIGSEGLELIFWSQGESDGIDGETETNYKTDEASLIAQMRTDFTNSSGQTNIPVVIAELTTTSDATATDDTWQAIKNAKRTNASTLADCYLLTATDLPRKDTYHYTDAAYITYGQRLAQIAGFINGDVTYYRGAEIASFTANSSTETDINLTHTAGTDFTPTTAITGFRVLDAGTPETISAAVRQDATTIRLTHGTVAGAISVDYLYGKAPTITGIVLDNTALTLPLEGQQSITEVAGSGIIPIIASHYRNNTGSGL